jgi:hypothetical protein
LPCLGGPSQSLLTGRPLTRLYLPRLVVSTAASLHGWGAHCPQLGLWLQGVWSPHESLYHIHVLELLAVHLALSRMVPPIRDSSVVVLSDNTTVVAYIYHDGGTRSPTLNRFTRALIMWCLANRVSIRAVHFAGADNVVHDCLSRPLHGPLAPFRDRFLSVAWSLDQGVAHQLFQRWGPPGIDLFATVSNGRSTAFAVSFLTLWRPRGML